MRSGDKRVESGFLDLLGIKLGEVVVEEDQHRADREALLLGEEDSLLDVFALCRLPGFSILQPVIEDIYL